MQQVPQIGHWHNELYENEDDPPMRNKEKNLLTHQKGLMGNPKNLTHEYPKGLHEGHVKSSKLMFKGH